MPAPPLTLALAMLGSVQSLSEQQSRADALVHAWARTGSCRAPPIVGRCGVIAAVVTEGGGAPIVAQAAAGDALPLPAAQFRLDTLFEIASNTKVLTAVTFQRMAAEGLVAENETLSAFLPGAGVQRRTALAAAVLPLRLQSPPRRVSRARPGTLRLRNTSVGEITMSELLSHTSGLARLPSNLHGPPPPQHGRSAHAHRPRGGL
eukprot:SAG11_NODE_929_length_6503_cov_9.709557_8_plen_205_part_00